MFFDFLWGGAGETGGTGGTGEDWGGVGWRMALNKKHHSGLLGVVGAWLGVVGVWVNNQQRENMPLWIVTLPDRPLRPSATSPNLGEEF